jgi:putative spermidine/putrescine transport system substrate-binding protein
VHTSLKALATIAAAGALLATAACSPPEKDNSSSSGGSKAASAASASEAGGMDALIAAAKKEGTLTTVALPPDWANYKEIIDTFSSKYGIKVNSTSPDFSSQEEINAVNQLKGTGRQPDVVDVTPGVALANTKLFAPYQVSSWADIPADRKESTGLWFQDYSGIMSVGYDSAKVPAPTSLESLKAAAYKGKVALNGDPTQAGAAINGLMMASLANGGSLDDISKGVEYFTALKKAGTFTPVQATTATRTNGTTPVVFDWDYLNAAATAEIPTWKTFIPDNAVLSGFYCQAINKDAAHPAAARLWEEFLYSDEGQNLWLKGLSRPVRMDAMQKSGTIDKALAAKLPAVSGTPVSMSDAQSTAAKDYLAKNWAKAIG